MGDCVGRGGLVRAVESEPVEGPWTLPEGWRWDALPQAAEICDYLRRPVKSAERLQRITGKSDDELYPYYGATGQAGVIDGYLADGEYILLGEDGAPFLEPSKPKAYAVSGRFWVNNHAHVLKARSHLDARLLLHWLNTIRYEPYVNGTTRLKLTQGAMAEMPVPIPPEDVQPRLSAHIGELIAEIEDGERHLELARGDLKTWRKALLKAAVTGELTADWRAANPPAETGPDLLARILADRRTRWDTDPRTRSKRYSNPVGRDVKNLSALPDGWTWVSVDQLTADQLIGLDRGRSLQSGSPTDGIAYVKMNNVTMDGHITWGNLKYVTADKDEIARYGLDDGDILFNTRNSLELVGKCGCVKNPPEGAIYNNNLLRIRLGSLVDPDFIALQMTAGPFRAELERVKRATTSVAAIYVNSLLPLPLAVPPLEEQRAIVASVHEVMSGRLEYDLTIEATSLRQSLLLAAFRGELTA